MVTRYARKVFLMRDRLPTGWVRGGVLGYLLLLSVHGALAQQTLPDSPSAVLAQNQSLSGAVKDVGGTPVGDATVNVVGPGGFARSTTTDEDGEYRFEGVPVGEFVLTVKAEGLAESSAKVAIEANEQKTVDEFSLKLVAAHFEVNAISQVQMAEIQLKQEEQQRLLGILPNFFVTYDHNAVPLTSKQKFKLATHNALDPVNIGVVALVAGVEQIDGTFSGYGSDMPAYGERFGAGAANLAIGTYLGGAIYPSLFHQDPRYFYKGTGTIRQRALYALSTAVRQKGDNGKWQPAYSSILGDFSATAIANAYYPPQNRNGAGLTLGLGALTVLSDAVNNLVQEFVLNHVTTKGKKQKSTP
jgi:hypothetical protein